jgi:hypothetical protein
MLVCGLHEGRPRFDGGGKFLAASDPDGAAGSL